MIMEKYRYWEILEEMPEGWQIDKTAGSPCPNTVFITNGKSVLNGQKRALLKVEVIKTVQNIEAPKELLIEHKNAESTGIKFPAKTVNQLARLKFKEQILKDILFDLTVCELEGWDKKEYINEIKKLLSSIETTPKKSSNTSQQKLF